MKFSDVNFKVKFKYSNIKIHVTLQELGDCVINLLEYYGEENILGREFCSIIGEGDGETKYFRLLQAIGKENDSWGFFVELIQELERANSREPKPIIMNGIELPYLLLMEVLKKLIPGNRFYEVRKVRQLERLTNTKVPDDEREKLQEVLDLYPVRLSLHTIRQMRLSKNVDYQFMPFVDELDLEGLVHTWVGQFHRGIVEQMYNNRVIFILNMSCPVYCRFCFRKHKECRDQRAPTKDHVREAVNYIRNSPDVKEIVLTGGDPFMNRPTLTGAIDGLKKIPHVQTLRIATRAISYYPHLFYKDDSYWMNYLKSKSLELLQKGKKLEIATHFIHPDEISIESLDIISELVKSGISVYVQTPFLRDCNDRPEILVDLFKQLRGAGAEIHYIYIPCSPIQGNRRYIDSISKGIEVAAGLRAYLSDRAIPGIVTATSIGKIDWNTSGWAVDVDEEDKNFLWIRTPYTMEYYNTFAPILQLSDSIRINACGNIEVKFMADIGDESLLMGNENIEPTISVIPAIEENEEKKQKIQEENLKQIYISSPRDQRFLQSIVLTGSKSLFRPHITRVEMNVEISDEELKYNQDYIWKNQDITDVILSARIDTMELSYKVAEIIKMIHSIKHVNAIRLRSLKFNYVPELYTKQIIDRLGELNRLNITVPKRLEIETQFLHSSEFKPEHKKLAVKLAKKGITVYNITPLLWGVNDDPEEMLRISYNCRRNGLEFQNLYFAGLPIQEYWNVYHPIEISRLFEITTRLRKNGSGREIPRYIIRTPIGEVDFALTSKIVGTNEDGTIRLKLLPYTMDYYKRIFPGYIWPDNLDVEIDKDGKPIVSVPELVKEELSEI
ncbi:MAG: radical SAM protein [Candidatus Eremiobacteraeota bacterium]|nr:radical SAM protein [Candidatus Eremiobacteraeota bacterium]